MKDEDKMDKFDGTNYYAWALRMRSVLESKGLWEYVEKHVDLLEDGTQEEKNDQKEENCSCESENSYLPIYEDSEFSWSQCE